VIALIGDYNPAVTAHQAIPKSLQLADPALEFDWIGTDTIQSARRQLKDYAGIWCVPASPYRNTDGALAAIQFAREQRIPFLGTCGGFQHALLEYARNGLGLAHASHAELEPAASEPFIAPLACALVEQTGAIHLVPRTHLHRIYGADQATEGYHCRYGLNPRYEALLSDSPLMVGARDDAGEVRAIELDGHPFFIATLFQPEREALRGERHPLIQAFVDAASA
jgi:CTP synthase (UTP-ammonia lyase)